MRRFSFSRRRLLAGLCAGLATASLPVRASSTREVTEKVSRLEREIGGRIGLAAVDSATGAHIRHRAEERFAMCSTFKLMLAAAVLSRADSGSLGLDQRIRYSRTDLLPHSPVTEAHVGEGSLPVETLARALVEVSDNTAANLLLALTGGPDGYTSFLRRLGDQVTRLDRIELALNSNLPGDPRDTTSATAMIADMTKMLNGSLLTAPSRARLLTWMRDCQTGRGRLRARLPPGWLAGDKTGTGDHGAVNDLAIFWPPQRPPILVACYLTESNRSQEVLDDAHAQIGALVAAAFVVSR
jgi:beta-lactamase class A